MIRILIARHGNTFPAGTPPRRVGSREDLPLTAEGRKQAISLGRYLSHLGFDISVVHAAPLRRTQQTAAAIVGELSSGAPIEIAPWLREIDHGPDEGRIEADVVFRVGTAAIRAWDTDGIPPAGWKVDTTSLMNDWRRAAARATIGTQMFVTSNGVARFALLALVQTSRPCSLKLRTGAFGVIILGKNGAAVERWDERPPENG